MSKPSKRIINQLKKYGKDTPLFSLESYSGYARLMWDLHDGDTLKVILPLPNSKSYYKFIIRMDKLDTCEMTSKNEKCKELAVKAKNRLVELTEFKDDPEDVCLIWVECKKNDKFGRILADIKKYESDPETFAEILKREKLAYHYTGGTKLTEEEQIELLS